MAITSAQLQTALDNGSRGPKVMMELPPYGAASQYWLISGGHTSLGITKMVTTTAASNAATQAAAIVVKLAKANGHD